MADRDPHHVASLQCSVCTQFPAQLELMRNLRLAFIDDTTNVHISTVKDHAATDMHAQAMLLYKKQQSTNICD